MSNRFKAKKITDGLEIVFTNQISIEEAKQRKATLEANIKSFQHQLEQIEKAKALAEEELQEIQAALNS